MKVVLYTNKEIALELPLDAGYQGGFQQPSSNWNSNDCLWLQFVLLSNEKFVLKIIYFKLVLKTVIEEKWI